MKVGQTFNEISSIQLEHSSDRNKTVLHSIDVRTKLFNEILDLPENKAVAFQIPEGYKTDGASIPSFLWWWISPLAWWILFASIVHDWCWREQFFTAYIVDLETKEIEKKLGVHTLTYKQGTQIMLEKMSSFYGGFISRHLVYFTLEIVRKVFKRKK